MPNHATRAFRVRVEPFNSLFEMQYGEQYVQWVLNSGSFNSLFEMLKPVPAKTLSSHEPNFQFSI